MRDVWRPWPSKARQRRLKAILIESSYTGDRPDAQLFGHLTPKWILKSLRELDPLAGGNALTDLPVIVTHIKYALSREQPQARMPQGARRPRTTSASASSFPSRELAGTSE